MPVTLGVWVYILSFVADLEQQWWIDDIILPSLAAVMDDDERAHYPIDFKHIRRHAHLKGLRGEANSGNSIIDNRRDISESRLLPFWETVKRRCAIFRPPNAPRDSKSYFADPFLVVSAYGLKLPVRALSPAAAHDKYFDMIDRYFNMQFVESADWWLDFAWEKWFGIFSTSAIFQGVEHYISSSQSFLLLLRSRYLALGFEVLASASFCAAAVAVAVFHGEPA